MQCTSWVQPLWRSSFRLDISITLYIVAFATDESYRGIYKKDHRHHGTSPRIRLVLVVQVLKYLFYYPALDYYYSIYPVLYTTVLLYLSITASAAFPGPSPPSPPLHLISILLFLEFRLLLLLLLPLTLSHSILPPSSFLLLTRFNTNWLVSDYS